MEIFSYLRKLIKDHLLLFKILKTNEKEKMQVNTKTLNNKQKLIFVKSYEKTNCKGFFKKQFS